MTARRGRILVTGASGFVGRALCQTLAAAGYPIRVAGRRRDGLSGHQPHEAVWVDLTRDTDWRPLLTDVEAVVHLAGLAHRLAAPEAGLVAAYRRINTDATLELARAAAGTGVKRFLFVSSIKVNGEATPPGRPYTEADPADPRDEYARSKWRAEQGLETIADETGLQVVSLRPPLVYGPGVGANFRRLMQGVEAGWPLPLGAIANRRSLLYLDNLTAALMACLEAPRLPARLYLVADREAVSTPELIRRLAREMGRPPRLLPIPMGLLGGVARLAGRQADWQRLSASLEVDAGRLERDLGWSPPYRLDQGLAATVQAYFQDR